MKTENNANTTGLSLAQRFASALDRDDFDEAGRCLAPDCRYQLKAEVLTGPRAILASYRESTEWGSRVLDQVMYESEVKETAEGASITFIDHITHRGRSHTYRSRQHLRVNAAGLIAHITHEELPGERERLDEFFASCGVTRP